MSSQISAGRVRAGIAAAGPAGAAAFAMSAGPAAGVDGAAGPEVALTGAADGLGDLTSILGTIAADEVVGVQDLGMTVFMDIPEGMQMAAFGIVTEMHDAFVDLGQQEFTKAGDALLAVPGALLFGAIMPFAGVDAALNQMFVAPVEQIWHDLDPADVTGAAAGDDFGLSNIAGDLTGLL